MVFEECLLRGDLSPQPMQLCDPSDRSRGQKDPPVGSDGIPFVDAPRGVNRGQIRNAWPRTRIIPPQPWEEESDAARHETRA